MKFGLWKAQSFIQSLFFSRIQTTEGSTRKDASYAKDYIHGKYGAVPYVEYSEFVDLFKKSRDKTKMSRTKRP